MSARHLFRRPPGVTAHEAMTMIDAGALVIDVRAPRDWRRQHIPGSLNIPLAQLEAHAPDLSEDGRLITFCTGGLLSSGAAGLLREWGFDAVNLSRGLIAWRSAGGALEGEP